jgi:hypothetical protein
MHHLCDVRVTVEREPRNRFLGLHQRQCRDLRPHRLHVQRCLDRVCSDGPNAGAESIGKTRHPMNSTCVHVPVLSCQREPGGRAASKVGTGGDSVVSSGGLQPRKSGSRRVMAEGRHESRRRYTLSHLNAAHYIHSGRDYSFRVGLSRPRRHTKLDTFLALLERPKRCSAGSFQ